MALKRVVGRTNSIHVYAQHLFNEAVLGFLAKREMQEKYRRMVDGIAGVADAGKLTLAMQENRRRVAAQEKARYDKHRWSAFCDFWQWLGLMYWSSWHRGNRCHKSVCSCDWQKG